MPYLHNILNSVNRKYETRIQEICLDWRRKVQEGIKELLKMSMAQGTSIKFNILPACPSHIINQTLTTEQYSKFILFQNKQLLERLITDLPQYSDFIDRNKKILPIEPVEENNIGSLTDYISTLYNKIPSKDELIQLLTKYNEDVFGSYVSDYNKGEVNIYWSIIGLFAERWNLDLEGFVITILSHEYAHAYTHLAIDANNGKWGLIDFRNSSKYIKEGLAEYYSLMFILQQKKESWVKIYGNLLKNSPEVYQDYLKWGSPSLEAMRYALIHIRKKTPTEKSYEEFKKLVNEGIEKYGKDNNLEDLGFTLISENLLQLHN